MPISERPPSCVLSSEKRNYLHKICIAIARGPHYFRYPVSRGAGVVFTSEVRKSAVLLLLIIYWKVRGMGDLQCYNIHTKFREDRSDG